MPGRVYDAIFNDGDITTDGKNDILILLMGGGLYNHKIYDASNPGAYWYGLYYSTNGGVSFEKSVFTGEADEIYKHSIVSGLFNTTDYIESDPVDPSVVYFYIEGGNEAGVEAGGLFVSNDYGRTLRIVIDYRNKGAIDIDPLWPVRFGRHSQSADYLCQQTRAAILKKSPDLSRYFMWIAEAASLPRLV